MYSINEVFTSPQGEGANVGRLAVFVRFSGCNLTCSGQWSGGVYQPVCDTDFSGGTKLGLRELVDGIVSKRVPFVVLTGGEPALQVDDELVNELHKHELTVAIETNGTKPIPAGLDYVAVSPKTAEHTLAVTVADELRYVRAHGQALPKPRITTRRRYLSPPFQADGSLRGDDLAWCLHLIRQDPKWRLSVQTHKLLKMR